jgi:hypothetical protein
MYWNNDHDNIYNIKYQKSAYIQNMQILSEKHNTNY